MIYSYRKRGICSMYRFIQIMKKYKLLPESFPDDAVIPPDPERKIFLVHVQPKFMIGCKKIKEVFLTNMENTMNFNQMVEAVREGRRATRQTWKEGEFVFSNGQVLVHNKSYWTNETFNQAINGFPYVVEHVDVVATDWQLCG